ncbi:MAG: hydroxymethylbilane synthase [Chloroflexaceae bacterium]|nr:hydroxymethylbilane synthase [Chloroflexaceae bacterium]
MQVQRIVVGTRGSKLAMAQATHVAAELRRHYPDCEVELRIISTKGDRILDVALSAVGDKGLFVKEIEVALLEGEVDLAVHSGKDLPSQNPDELVLAAFPPRVNPRDALILPHSAPTGSPIAAGNDQGEPSPLTLNLVPHGARIGTSSLRRACQLRSLRPDLQVLDVRGNVDTRLRKLDDGEYDALILAFAGLERLGLAARCSQVLPPDTLLPAVAQGALIIETRRDDSRTLEMVAVLDDPTTRAAVLAERAFLRRLEGGCQVPIAAYATVPTEGEGGKRTLHLRGLVGSLDGREVVRGERDGTTDAPEAVGTALAEELLNRGARTILEEVRQGITGTGGIGAP